MYAGLLIYPLSGITEKKTKAPYGMWLHKNVVPQQYLIKLIRSN